MFNLGKLLWALLTLSVFSFTAISQDSRAVEQQQELRQRELNKELDEKQVFERLRTLDKLSQDSLNSRQRALNNTQKPKSLPMTAEQKAIIKKILSPDSEDLAKYRTFLREPNTGIFRLFPDLEKYSKATICADGNCFNTNINTWSYSFRQKDYSDDTVLDLRLKNETLISDGLFSQGILVDLGSTTALEDVSLTSKGMKFLIDFKPETEISKARNKYIQIAKGIKFDDYNYTNTVKTTVNTTYGLRLIAYRFDIDKVDDFVVQHGGDANKYQLLKGDKRDDLIIAFRIIRKEDNGNITILWKRLKHQEAAKIDL